MNFEKLLKEKKIELVERSEFRSELSDKDISFAVIGLETENYDRVMTVAYEAVLRVGLQLMNFLGFRPIGREHHKNLFEFLGTLGIDSELIEYFDRIRRRRNDFLYRNIESFSKEDAEETITKARDLVQEIRTFVQEIRTEAKNE